MRKLIITTMIEDFLPHWSAWNLSSESEAHVVELFSFTVYLGVGEYHIVGNFGKIYKF